MKDTHIVSISDADLWQKFKSGEEAAFGLIFRTHYKALFNYGLKFNNNRELVEDCVQELFLELWKNKDSISQTDSIKPYLLKSIRRKIIKQTNTDTNLKKLFHHVVPKEYEFEVIFSPEHQLIHAQMSEEKVKKLQTMLDSLPLRQKEVLYLLFYQDMSYEEISQIMSMNYQSARNLVHRAIKLLREHSLLDTLIISFIFLKIFQPK
jgi:RNA polymerase sigma factor (sigma-70 family)